MTTLNNDESHTLTNAKTALRAYAEGIEADPQNNSVFAYARDLFRSLEDGEQSTQDLSALINEVFSRLITERAERFAAQHAETDALDSRLRHLAAQGWQVFKQAVETPNGGIVFTAHPTFALSRETRQAFADYATQPRDISRAALEDEIAKDSRSWSQTISLKGEHSEVQSAIAHAQSALKAYLQRIYALAETAFPETWTGLRPAAPSLASWVGYDLDGRTDIHWSQSFALRLGEKAEQLARYVAALDKLVAGGETESASALLAIRNRLQEAQEVTSSDYAAFDTDLTQPNALVQAANTLTTPDSRRLTHLTDQIAQLRAIAETEGETAPAIARACLILASEMETLGLGTARIHLRLNAAQIRTVISRDLALETENRELGRSALHKLSELAQVDTALPVNFADLFLQQSTARRQFMMCAQFLKHIDADMPIRFLIAESENPATVMGALYLARQYGVAEKLDISPLFETPEALETGGRFIEQLLAEPEYRRYLKARGHLSIQLGFSDAGRFIGQVAADMAIERIHNLISRAVATSAEPMPLLIFNTHGESMGRGAWPGPFEQRFDHLLSQWSRLESRRRGVPLRHEVSFQGGDGFLHFATPALAKATFDAFALHLLSEPDPGTRDDPFYGRTDLVWDFYRALRRWHERLFDDPDYGRLLNDFATNFLVKAGSRQRRRSSGPAGPRALRAISHNATLQQLAIPANTAAGIGSALRREQDQVANLIAASPRFRSLIKLASIARSATSVPVLRAYASVYDPSFWVALSGSASDPERALAYRRIYYLLQDSRTYTSMEKIANKVSIDLSKFDPMLARMEKVPTPAERHEARLDVHLLHAIRLALMMQALSIAGRLPTVSTRHGASVEDMMNLIRTMQIGAAVALLRDIFPASRPGEDSLQQIKEAGHLTGDSASGYDQIHAQIIAPLETIDALMHQLTLVICQAYGAYG